MVAEVGPGELVLNTRCSTYEGNHDRRQVTRSFDSGMTVRPAPRWDARGAACARAVANHVCAECAGVPGLTALSAGGIGTRWGSGSHWRTMRHCPTPTAMAPLVLDVKGILTPPGVSH
jgi:hypothetical protein